MTDYTDSHKPQCKQSIFNDKPRIMCYSMCWNVGYSHELTICWMSYIIYLRLELSLEFIATKLHMIQEWDHDITYYTFNLQELQNPLIFQSLSIYCGFVDIDAKYIHFHIEVNRKCYILFGAHLTFPFNTREVKIEILYIN